MLGLPTSLFRRWLVRVTGTFFPVPVTVHSRARFLLLAKFGLKRSEAYINRFLLLYTVKNIVVEFPELPIFSVIFTRRLVRGFPTYRTLLEIM